MTRNRQHLHLPDTMPTSPGSAPVLLRVCGLEKSYMQTSRFGHTALRGVSFKVCEGECVGIVGPSGCGKSTTARIVARLECPDAGSVFFNGQTLGSGQGKPGVRPSRAKRKQLVQAWSQMRMVFQNPEASFAPTMTVGQAVAEGVRYTPGFKRLVEDAGSLERLVADALEDVELPAAYAAKRAFEISGGECQRAALARAIIGQPRLIVCDEPTSALDVTIQARIMALLEHLHTRHGTAFLFISHDLALVNGFCDRIYRMEAGSMVEELQVVRS